MPQIFPKRAMLSRRLETLPLPLSPLEPHRSSYVSENTAPAHSLLAHLMGVGAVMCCWTKSHKHWSWGLYVCQKQLLAFCSKVKPKASERCRLASLWFKNWVAVIALKATLITKVLVTTAHALTGHSLSFGDVCWSYSADKFVAAACSIDVTISCSNKCITYGPKPLLSFCSHWFQKNWRRTLQSSCGRQQWVTKT